MTICIGRKIWYGIFFIIFKIFWTVPLIYFQDGGGGAAGTLFHKVTKKNSHNQPCDPPPLFTQ